MEAKDQWFLKTFLAIAMVIAPGKTNTCNSSPQCYKTTEEASTYICEWKSMKNATYELFYRRSNSTRSLPCSERTQNNYCCVNEEEMYSKVYVDIWVVVNIGNQSCISPISTVRLEESVKYNAPKNVSMSRSSSTLNISWNNDNGNPCDEDGEQTYKNGAEIEVKYRRREVPSETWNTIKEVVEKAMFTLKDLQPQSVYQLQVRHKSNQKIPLWSNWTPILNVSTEIQNPPEVIYTLNDFNNGTRLLKLTWGTPPYPDSMEQVNYNLSLNIWPCQPKRNAIFHFVNATEFSVLVTYSAVSGSIFAFNKVGKSSRKDFVVQAKHLTSPNKSWCDTPIQCTYVHSLNKCCLAWNKLTVTKTDRHIQRLNGTVNATLEIIRKAMDDYVPYYYLVHCNTEERPHTTEMGLMYKKEGAPRSKPKDFTSKKTHNSAMLHWKPIPLPEQQGFLTHYTVCYTKNGQNKEAKSTDTECHNTSASAKDYLLQNLTPGTLYEVSVAGATAAGLGPNSITSFMTNAQDLYKGWIKYCFIFLFTIIIITAFVFIIKRT
ncbi:hypothetical protein UPYG_G00030590 [Umbra pygmaea]|uniref:Fibronectin type-III domain-containing protein n=1 Tax=Umbra pygmaea TaxID=75934 RepID=A0ABD0YBP1_UMBPY